MKCIKKGNLYTASGLNGFDQSHCHKPTPIIINNRLVRVYFGTRDSSNKTRTTFVDLDINNLNKIVYIHNKPVLGLGKIGTFDDSGANVSSVIRFEDKIYMYYIGWNPSTTVHTRNSIGLAVSEDNGLTFHRLYDGPILDRNTIEPYYTGAVDVIKEKNIWKIYYTSGSEWKIINDKPEIFYHIKYATSHNGIDWIREDKSCIPPNHEFEATARPCVIKTDNLYRMWFSKRDIRNFRQDKQYSYRAGYAESIDGIDWRRKDGVVGLDISDSGWDSQSIAYPYVINIKEKLTVFYNGNGFGKTGFGYGIYE